MHADGNGDTLNDISPIVFDGNESDDTGDNNTRKPKPRNYINYYLMFFDL